jgi:transposase
VAALGVSSYTFAEATWSQELPCWIGSHIRALENFGGLPMLVVPDNLKAGVTKACRYEPDLNPTYSEMAAYYGVAVLPARHGGHSSGIVHIIGNLKRMVQLLFHV